MIIPTEVVGPLPRPTRLQEALDGHAAGTVPTDDVRREQELAAADSIHRLELVGETIVTDGAQRDWRLARYPLPDVFAHDHAERSACHAPPRILVATGNRLLGGWPSPTGFRYRCYAREFVERNRTLTASPLKQTVVAPSTLARLFREEDLEPRVWRRFLDDLCDQCETDVRGCFAAGAARVCFDFIPACDATDLDPPSWRRVVRRLVELDNRVLARFTAEERRHIGVHVCAGRAGSAEVRDVLLEEALRLDAGYFLVPYASSPDPARVLETIARHGRDAARGVAPRFHLGVVDPSRTAIETPEEVCEALVRAARVIPLDRLGATDDGGHAASDGASGDCARDRAMRKIAARVRGAGLARAALG